VEHPVKEKRRPCVKCGRNRAERFFVSDRGRVCLTCRSARRRQQNKMAHQKTTFGLSKKDYAALLAAQDGKCAICRGFRRRYDTDHDHKIVVEEGLSLRRALRGLLCARCNRKLLPAGLDDPELFRRAAEYLEAPPARRVLEMP
jgi:hypothetical protein